MNGEGVETGLSRDDSRVTSGSLTWTSGSETEPPPGTSSALGTTGTIRQRRLFSGCTRCPRHYLRCLRFPPSQNRAL